MESDFQRLNTKWTRFGIPCGQNVLNLCNKKFCLPTLKSLVVPSIKQGLPVNQHPENWRFSLHNLIRKSPNSRLGLRFHCTFYCSLFWQHSGILIVPMDQALTLFMVWLKSLSQSLSFSPQMVLAQESNLAAPSPFLITLRTRENQNKINWQCKELKVIEFLIFSFS